MDKFRVLGVSLFILAGCSFSGAPVSSSDGDGDGESPVDELDAGTTPDASGPDAAAPTDALLVAKTPVPFDVTDAGFDLAEWSALPRHEIRFGRSHEHLDPGYSQDASATFGAAHDASYLYLIIEVIDDESFDADKVELYFDTGADRQGVYGADDSYVEIDRTATWNPNGTNITLDGTLMPSGSGGDLIYALRFAKAQLGAGVTTGAIGFNVSLWDADNTAGDGGWVLWRQPDGPHCDSCCTDEPHGEPWCDTTMLGEMVLLP